MAEIDLNLFLKFIKADLRQTTPKQKNVALDKNNKRRVFMKKSLYTLNLADQRCWLSTC